VYLHLGLPKTGTTYLQQVLSNNRESLRDQGLLYPGALRDHFLPVQDVMQHKFRDHYDERAAGTWSPLLQELRGWQKPALISHEIMCLAQPDQIKRVIGDLADREVRVLVTARDLLRQLPAVWQEAVKNGESDTLQAFVDRVKRNADSDAAPTRGFWAYQDLPRILGRWEEFIPADRIFVVTVPPSGTAPDLLWSRAAEVLGVELSAEQVEQPTSNTSLGAAEAEFLRRVNEQVSDTLDWPIYREQIKRNVVRRLIAKGRDNRRITLRPSDAEWAVEYSQRVVATLANRRYQLVGNLEDLRSSLPDLHDGAVAELPEEEVVEAGVVAVAGLLRRIGNEHRPGSDTPSAGRTLRARRAP